MLDDQGKKAPSRKQIKRRTSTRELLAETATTELSSSQQDGPDVAQAETANNTTEAQQKHKLQKVDKKKTETPSEKHKPRGRRRSLFSVLFAQNRTNNSGLDQKVSDDSSCSSSSCSIDCNEFKKSTSQHKKNLSHSKRPTSARGRRNESDIVLIKPNEARCVEATVASLVNDDVDLDGAKVAEPAARKHSGGLTSGAQEKSSSFFRRRMRRFRGKKQTRDEDADSYVLDLNDCLDREKLRMSSSSSSSSTSCSASFSSFSSFSSLSSPNEDAKQQRRQPQPNKAQVAIPFLRRNSSKNKSKSKVESRVERDSNERDGAPPAESIEVQATKECSPLRETSPIEDLWQTNKEYIPAKETNNNNSLKKHPKKQASPTLVEFLQSHQIHLGVMDSSQLTSGQDSHRSTSSSRDSLSCSNWNSSLIDNIQQQPPLNPIKLNQMSESDRRLYHWRKLAARSVSMWQVPEDSSSDEDDSNSGTEFLDCHRPAMVCYCSDDTSCSSVELVWSPRLPSQTATAAHEEQHRQELERQRQLLNTRPPLHLLTPHSVTPLSWDFNRSSSSNLSVSPIDDGRQRLHSPAARLSSKSPPLDAGLNPKGYAAADLVRQNGRRKPIETSCNNSYRSSSDRNRSAVCQKPSILELAKPSRARDRRIGRDDEPERYKRIRRPKVGAAINHSQAPDRPMLQPGGVIPVQDQKAQKQRPATRSLLEPYEQVKDAGREWSAVPVSRPGSASDWHPNPLFGRVRNSPEAIKLPANDDPNEGSASFEAAPLKTRSCDEPSFQPDDGRPKQALRRHSSVANNLPHHHQQQRDSAIDSEKQPTNSKSNRFMSFLARIKSRQDTSGHEQTLISDPIGDECQIKENLDTISMNGFGSSKGRAKRHRWSLRMRSPFAANNSTNVGPSQAPSSDHAYLSQVSANLDKLKSQLSERLSDTGKRASVLADQLITSIKDSTKEQLLIATTGTSARDRYDTLPNSFASPGGGVQSDPLLVHKQLKHDGLNGNNTNDRKAKLFSLIYMHQQQQADGRPVITRQPTSTGRRGLQGAGGVATSALVGSERPLRPAPPASRPQSISICQQDGEQVANSEKTATASESLVDLEKLMDPKELLMDRFRALRAREVARYRRESGLTRERLSQTIAADSLVKRHRVLNQHDQSFKSKGLQEEAEEEELLPKRRSSCTV